VPGGPVPSGGCPVGVECVPQILPELPGCGYANSAIRRMTVRTSSGSWGQVSMSFLSSGWSWMVGAKFDAKSLGLDAVSPLFVVWLRIPSDGFLIRRSEVRVLPGVCCNSLSIKSFCDSVFLRGHVYVLGVAHWRDGISVVRITDTMETWRNRRCSSKRRLRFGILTMGLLKASTPRRPSPTPLRCRASG